jgi:hypothetical protein
MQVETTFKMNAGNTRVLLEFAEKIQDWLRRNINKQMGRAFMLEEHYFEEYGQGIITMY